MTVFLPDFPLLDPNHDLAPDDDDEDDGEDDGAQDQGGPAHGTGDENGLSILPLGLRSGVDGGDNNNHDDDDDMVSSGSEDDDEDDILARGLRGELNGDGGDAGFPGEAPVDRRQQFGQLRRQFLICHPALSPELNAHIWETAGKMMPLISATLPAGQGNGTKLVTKAVLKGGKHENDRAEDEDPESEGSGDDEQEGEEVDDEQDVRQQQQGFANRGAANLPTEANPHPGAGTSIIGGTGSSMNHVVALEWSPPGLGRNLRPVLAVLTGVGSLAVYGDGAHLPFGSTDKPWRVLGKGAAAAAVRNLDSWLALWAVGENFVVPGQEAYGYGEFVQAFAWCREMGPGRALLAYVNDLRELVVVCVGTCFRTTADKGLDEAVWNVREVLRMETAGPHGQSDVSSSAADLLLRETSIDAMRSLMIRISFPTDPAIVYGGALGKRVKRPGPACCHTWTGTTWDSRRSP